jgi:hypothetical protein
MPFFEWMEGLAIYGSSVYIGPALNIVHLMGMVVFLGAILIVDLRLLGAGLKRHPTAAVARDAQPWLIGGLVVLVLTGIPATMATATDQYANSIFWAKMYLLALGLVFLFTIRRLVTSAEEGRVPSAARKATGLVSIFIWLGVAALARLIMMIPANTFEWLVGAAAILCTGAPRALRKRVLPFTK